MLLMLEAGTCIGEKGPYQYPQHNSHQHLEGKISGKTLHKSVWVKRLNIENNFSPVAGFLLSPDLLASTAGGAGAPHPGHRPGHRGSR
jgi:hypothetical protein